jgi:sugar transferase (PEP-CTERM/EpsH1 system associated)
VNILFISTENPFPVDHGHHLRTYYVLKTLAQENRVFFIGFTQDNSGFRYQDELKKMCESVDIFQLRYHGWRQQILALKNIFSSKPLIVEKYFDTRAVKRIQELIAGGDIDVVHIDMLHIAAYKNAINTVPCVLTNHNVESVRILRWSNVVKNPFLKTYLRLQYKKLQDFEGRVCGQFDRCIVVSEYDRECLRQMCGDLHFEIVANGVDAVYFQPARAPTRPNELVWTGSMKGPYNRDAVQYFLAEIWPLIHQVHPGITVNFVGDSPVEQLVRLAEKSAHVKYTGYVEDVRPYVADAAVFIAPLRSGSGTKIKVLNAMAQARPVVTTAIGAEGIEAWDGEEIIIADSPGEFAEKTMYLIQYPQEAKQIGLRARKVIEEKYAWSVLEEKIKNIYEDVKREHATA